MPSSSARSQISSGRTRRLDGRRAPPSLKTTVAVMPASASAPVITPSSFGSEGGRPCDVSAAASGTAAATTGAGAAAALDGRFAASSAVTGCGLVAAPTPDVSGQREANTDCGGSAAGGTPILSVTAGIAGGADVILTPEKPIDMDDVVRLLRARWECGKRFGIVVVAEGAKIPEIEGQITVGDKLDSFGHARLSGIGQLLAEEIEKRTGYETRSVTLGHTQRGGTPTAYDRMLATRYGIAAIDMVHEGKFGRMAVLKGTKICDISIADAIAQTRTVGEDIFAVIRGLQPAK